MIHDPPNLQARPPPSAGFVELLGHKLPSTNKFYTLQEPLPAEAGLYMIHGIGKKVPRRFKS